jgi:hypothetical protein
MEYPSEDLGVRKNQKNTAILSPRGQESAVAAKDRVEERSEPEATSNF